MMFFYIVEKTIFLDNFIILILKLNFKKLKNILKYLKIKNTLQTIVIAVSNTTTPNNSFSISLSFLYLNVIHARESKSRLNEK
jgi:hypothetical protein